jgi:phage terminase Nu1 subunit (DNA packaging protein)
METPLTKTELATVLKVHPQTIDKWNAKGMPRVRAGTRNLYIFSHCWLWLQERTKGPNEYHVQSWNMKLMNIG